MSFCKCLRPNQQKSGPKTPERLLVNWENAFINCQEDSELVKELLSYLVTGLNESTEKITKDYKNLNYTNVSDVAHRIKGDSASLACEDLMFHAEKLQTNPKERVNVDNLLNSAKKTIECVENRYP